jgi:HSP20 family protein
MLDFSSEHWDPFEEMRSMQSEMNQLFGESFSRFSMLPTPDSFLAGATFSPRINIEDSGDSYIVTVDIPGAQESTIDVSIVDGNLELQGSTQMTNNESQSGKLGAMLHRERFFGSFRRSIPLPEDIEPNSLSQSYDRGTLRIEIKKKDT